MSEGLPDFAFLTPPDGRHSYPHRGPGLGPHRRAVGLPDVRQTDSYDCGQAVADCVRLHFGLAIKPLPCNWLDGTDVRLVEAAFRPDLNVQSGEMGLDDLAHHLGLGRLLVALVSEDEVGHWVVAHSIRNGLVQYHDPLCGPSAQEISRFVARWRDWCRFGYDYQCWGLSVWPRRARAAWAPA